MPPRVPQLLNDSELNSTRVPTEIRFHAHVGVVQFVSSINLQGWVHIGMRTLRIGREAMSRAKVHRYIRIKPQ